MRDATIPFDDREELRAATTDQHVQLFFNNSIANTIVTVESDWYTRISKQIIFRYCFDDESFELFDKTAGYYISRQIVKPLSVEKYENLLERLLLKGIELRFTTHLYPPREAILASESLIRSVSAQFCSKQYTPDIGFCSFEASLRSLTLQAFVR